MPLPPGTKLAQYEVTSALGSGGMGEVYKARDLRLDRDVAIKVMSAHVAEDPGMRRRFETEARAVAALSHPCILSIHELAFADGVPFAVMELLEGETLRQRLERGPLDWREGATIVASVAAGLAAAHAKGIVHRDLKPENVFLTSDGAVKVLDFGLALHRLGAVTATTGRTAAGVVLGTIGYMSPEQVTGERVDGRSDIFAAGCLLYEALTARRLFTGGTPQEIVAGLLSHSGRDLSAIGSPAPPELRTIVAKCVDREPDRRFESAADLASALRGLLSGSTGRTPARRTKRGRSLAVLPFVNSTADPQIEYLADGITEAIINSLSQLPGLRVVPRSLVFRYKGLQSDPSTVGLALSAKTILTGRVVQQDDVLDIQAELVDTANEAQLWGERYRRQISDVLAVQEEIAWQISEALRLKLSGEQKKSLRKRPTVKPEAYQEYLRGRFLWHNWNPESIKRAIEHFERALEFDPGYALAYTGLANAFGALSYYGIIDPAEGFPRARAAAARALELDSRLAEAHVTVGLTQMFWSWDWDAAGRALDQALAIDPNLPLALNIKGLYLTTLRRFDEALEVARKARTVDPVSPFISMGVAWVHHFAGRPADAISELEDVLSLLPGFEEGGNVLISSLESLGRYEEAAARIAKQPCWGLPIDAGRLLDAYRRGGAEAYWRNRLEQMYAANDSTPSKSFAFAICHAKLGEHDRALDHIERMINYRTGGTVFVAVDPNLRSLHGLPRFDALITRIGTPRAHAASAPHTART